MSSGRRVEIRRQKRLFDDFFKIDELIVSHQQYDGRMSGEERARVSEAQREERGGRLDGEEDIEVFHLEVDNLFDRLAHGAIDDPKLAIAAYWLKDNIDRL
jgi:hypothetical protein